MPMPILAEYDCCHAHLKITLPIGLQVKLYATNQSINLIENWVSLK